jgi:hypothetical protein
VVRLAPDEAQRARVVGDRFVVVAVECANRFRDMVAGIRYRELAGVPASTGETAANLTAGSR